MEEGAYGRISSVDFDRVYYFVVYVQLHKKDLKNIWDMIILLEKRIDLIEAIMNSDSIDKPTLVKTGTVTTESIKIRVRSI